MNQAYRVYTKHYRINNQSPVFRSEVDRNKQNTRSQMPGPGNYDISLPLLKPKYQKIIKNNHVIIKMNPIDKPFLSQEARFKTYKRVETNEDAIEGEGRSKGNNYDKSLNRYVNEVKEKNSEGKGTAWSKYKQYRNLWNQSELMPGPGSYQPVSMSEPFIFRDGSWQFRSQTRRLPSLKPSSSLSTEVPIKRSNTIHNRQNK